MDNLFYFSYSLTSVNLSNFDTEKVENMSQVFANCSLLSSIDVSSFGENTQYTDLFTGVAESGKIVLKSESMKDVLNVPETWDVLKKE